MRPRGQVNINKDTERDIGEAGMALSKMGNTGGKGKSTLAAAGSNVLDDPFAAVKPGRPSLLKKKTDTESN